MSQSSTVVLIPGLTCDATYWASETSALAGGAEVVVPRLHDLDSLVAMATSILDSNPGPLHVIGHSMGGRVAFEMVRLAPDRVATLAVLDTGAHPVAEGEPAQRQVRLDIAATGGMAAVAADWVPMMVHPDRRGDVELLDRITRMVTSYTVEQYRGQIQALLTRSDARPLLATITCPTLVACGRADGWSPVDQHREMAAIIPGARLAVIEDAGHMVSMEQPEATTGLLVDWLRTATAPATGS